MRAEPECLKRRYTALDNLMQELSASNQGSSIEARSNSDNVGIKLMCDFWNILKKDPDCNLTKEVQHHMNVEPKKTISNTYGSQQYLTYMAHREKKGCCGSSNSKSSRAASSTNAPTPSQQSSNDEWPLSKVLCNLKEAASFDKKCHVKVKELMEAQMVLKEQIQTLEDREKEGIELLKEADSCWLCMEDSYKKKLADALDSHSDLISRLKEVDQSCSKWRKNRKDLQFQIENMEKVKRDIKDDLSQKKNDLRIIEVEIKDLEKRVNNNAADIANTKKSMATRKETSNTRMANLASEMTKVQKRTKEQINHKKRKEEEGAQYVKEARDDLQTICKVLMKKKLENEDLKAERNCIIEELTLLNNSADTCKEKCRSKEENLKEDIKKLNEEIANFKIKCIKCHVCTDTSDARKLCTDCPRCLADRDCLYDAEHCSTDASLDCVCMSVKQKFLDNVFDNMYTVLERQSKTASGKSVADAVLNCLEKSRNGKLTPEVRKILQDFILTTVKKNLNLTIVGGAVKTRCEMDPDTYKQLMLCLNLIKPTAANNKEKGTDARKPPCGRWGGSTECNCPKGPNSCICSKKAPPPPNDPQPCPQDPEDAGPVLICPERAPKVCGPDCGNQGKSFNPADIAKWRPDPCSGPSCTFSQNMRAAQCVLETESLQRSCSLSDKSPANILPTCTCGSQSKSPCSIHRDARYQPRQRIIEEVMGGYNHMAPVSEVTRLGETISVRQNSRCDCDDVVLKGNISEDRKSLRSNWSYNYTSNRQETMTNNTIFSNWNSPCEHSDHNAFKLPMTRLPIKRKRTSKTSRFSPCSCNYLVLNDAVNENLRRIKHKTSIKNNKSSNRMISVECNELTYKHTTNCKRGGNKSQSSNVTRFPIDRGAKYNAKIDSKHGSNINKIRNKTLISKVNNEIKNNNKTTSKNKKGDTKVSFLKERTSIKCNNKSKALKSENDVKVILCPKPFKAYDDEMNIIDSSTRHSPSSDIRLNSISSIEINQDIKLSNECCIQKTLSGIDKNYGNNVIVNLNHNTLASTDNIEWISADKLLEEITLLTKVKHSSYNNDMNKEKVTCEILNVSSTK